MHADLNLQYVPNLQEFQVNEISQEESLLRPFQNAGNVGKPDITASSVKTNPFVRLQMRKQGNYVRRLLMLKCDKL